MKRTTAYIIMGASVVLGATLSVIFHILGVNEAKEREALSVRLDHLQAQASLLRDRQQADSLLRELVTPDLAFFSLHGCVRDMSDGENTISFDNQGHWNDTRGYTSEGGYALQFERNKFGRIIAAESTDKADGAPAEKIEYTWDGDLLTRVESKGYEASYTIKYTYDTHGRLASMLRINKDSSGESQISSTYSYEKSDRMGNWTQRTCRSAIKTVQYGGYYDDETGAWVDSSDPVIDSSEEVQQRRITYYD